MYFRTVFYQNVDVIATLALRRTIQPKHTVEHKKARDRKKQSQKSTVLAGDILNQLAKKNKDENLVNHKSMCYLPACQSQCTRLLLILRVSEPQTRQCPLITVF